MDCIHSFMTSLLACLLALSSTCNQCQHNNRNNYHDDNIDIKALAKNSNAQKIRCVTTATTVMPQRRAIATPHHPIDTSERWERWAKTVTSPSVPAPRYLRTYKQTAQKDK